jgi:holo-[acyl-carrier protein] synthase
LIDRCDYPLGRLRDRETLAIVFTPKEQNYCQSVRNSHVSYALCFGIKEAVGKALGIGLVGVDWNEIEADLTQSKPRVCLSGRAETHAQRLGIQQWLVDWWEWQECVFVSVLALSSTDRT